MRIEYFIFGRCDLPDYEERSTRVAEFAKNSDSETRAKIGAEREVENDGTRKILHLPLQRTPRI